MLELDFWFGKVWRWVEVGLPQLPERISSLEYWYRMARELLVRALPLELPTERLQQDVLETHLW